MGYDLLFSEGMVEKPTLDPSKAIAKVKNEDGSISTVRTLGFNIDGKEVLIPSVHKDGYIMSDEESIQHYKDTGEHFGKFDSPEASTNYAISLHDNHEKKFVGTKEK